MLAVICMIINAIEIALETWSALKKPDKESFFLNQDFLSNWEATAEPEDDAQ